MAAIIYLDVDDEITSAAARIRNATETKVALVLPPGSRLATSRINFRLLAREALERNRVLSIVAADPAARAIAASAGLPVHATVGELEVATAEPASTAPMAPAGQVSGDEKPAKQSRRRAGAAAVAGGAVAGASAGTAAAAGTTAATGTGAPAGAGAAAGALGTAGRGRAEQLSAEQLSAELVAAPDEAPTGWYRPPPRQLRRPQAHRRRRRGRAPGRRRSRSCPRPGLGPDCPAV